ncbi:MULTISPECIES: hypothetical protein [Aerococcus]|uniref:Uncharacterized protein n=1 Tax=Aerococcus tenax TaxID=3078812 RepID=A0A329PJL2_9LACT|nr:MULTISPECIES: hypothetical protein [Aerococcus]MDL5184750.1 hypothetical protein [Aerococcus mictus]KAA9238594.1 hypothetical protein F6I34_08095 [Aerococcus urinae]MDK6371975.1 hypothetical protein [Aerococcus urinae]MDK7302415.1 hypothetical protein [Aerococcus urinae]MDK7802274.1 hypothetical protein [Aerococcus urinae]
MNNGYYRNVLDANGVICSGRDLYRSSGKCKNPFKNVTILVCEDGRHVVPILNLIEFDRVKEWDYKKTVYQNALAMQKKYHLSIERLATAFGISEFVMTKMLRDGEDFKASARILALIKGNFNLETEYYRQVVLNHCLSKSEVRKYDK